MIKFTNLIIMHQGTSNIKIQILHFCGTLSIPFLRTDPKLITGFFDQKINPTFKSVKLIASYLFIQKISFFIANRKFTSRYILEVFGATEYWTQVKFFPEMGQFFYYYLHLAVKSLLYILYLIHSCWRLDVLCPL